MRKGKKFDGKNVKSASSFGSKKSLIRVKGQHPKGNNALATIQANADVPKALMFYF
ncbi:hypothetical protein [Echinicola rosea]|uniref:hypothetical protein n=1 Tax=Echinicola rosea TaxID=1807691 RepID=UPI00165158A9|nr:hypothetical protein [Echinicola rosea]